LFIERNLHDAAAFDYGEAAISTPIMLAVREHLAAGDRDAARATARAAGIELIHGHGAGDFAELYPEAPVVVWLRDPLERAVSEYLSHRRTPDARNALAQRIVAGDAGMDECLRCHTHLYANTLAQAVAPQRLIAVLPVDEAHDVAAVFGQELGWRGKLAVRNSAPAPDMALAHTLLKEHASARTTLLAAETDLYQEHLNAWRSGEGRDRARAALAQVRNNARRRPAGLLSASRLRLARRSLGIWRENLRRRLSQ